LHEGGLYVRRAVRDGGSSDQRTDVINVSGKSMWAMSNISDSIQTKEARHAPKIAMKIEPDCEQPADEQPTNEQPDYERPTNEQPTDEQPTDGLADEQPTGGLADEQPTDKLADEQLTNNNQADDSVLIELLAEPELDAKSENKSTILAGQDNMHIISSVDLSANLDDLSANLDDLSSDSSLAVTSAALSDMLDNLLGNTIDNNEPQTDEDDLFAELGLQTSTSADKNVSFSLGTIAEETGDPENTGDTGDSFLADLGL